MKCLHLLATAIVLIWLFTAPVDAQQPGGGAAVDRAGETRAAETPVEHGKLHPAPQGAASVPNDPAVDDWGSTFWWVLGGVVVLFVVLGAAGAAVSMKQRQRGGQSQEPRRT